MRGHIVDLASLPRHFPTHRHDDAFWTALGRSVATFGFLEETLAKAIFSFTATREYPEDEIDAAFVRWLPVLTRALSDQLGALIGSYEKAVRDHGKSDVEGFELLIEDLRKAAVIRNVLCHGSWRPPGADGGTIPFFVNRKGEVFDGVVNLAYLQQVQRWVAQLAAHVVSSVTALGWQFPGSGGPGETIMPKRG